MSDLFFRFNVAVITLKNPFIISKGKNSPTRYVNPICLPLRDNIDARIINEFLVAGM